MPDHWLIRQLVNSSQQMSTTTNQNSWHLPERGRQQSIQVITVSPWSWPNTVWDAVQTDWSCSTAAPKLRITPKRHKPVGQPLNERLGHLLTQSPTSSSFQKRMRLSLLRGRKASTWLSNDITDMFAALVLSVLPIAKALRTLQPLVTF